MGLMDKLKFWKKEEPLDIGKYPALEAAPNAEHPELGPPPSMTTPPEPLQELGAAPPPPPGHTPAPKALDQPLSSPITAPMQSAPQGSELQVVNAKLDTLKILLENINAKIDRLEKPEEEKPIPLSVKRWR